MSTDVEKAFLAFDWSKSEGWLSYFDGLFPTPPASKVFHFKKKWFKANVNNNLSMDFNLDNHSNSTPSSFPSTSSPAYSFSIFRVVAILFLFIGCVTTILYLIPLGFYNGFRNASLFFLLGFLLDIFERFGGPRFNVAYWQATLMDESGQAVFITIAGLGLRTWTALVSPFLTSLLLIAQYSNLWMNRTPKSFNDRIDPLVRKVNSNRYQIMQLRSNFEVMVGFATLMMIFVGASTLMTTILYWNAIRFRYQANPFTQATFRLIDTRLTGWTTSPICPRLVGSAYNFIKTHLRKLVQTQSD